MSPEKIKDHCIKGKLVFVLDEPRNMGLFVLSLVNAEYYLWRDSDLHHIDEGPAHHMDGWPGYFMSEQEARSMLTMFAKRMKRHGILVEVTHAEA